MSSMYIRRLIFPCDLLSLYPAVHFLSMWLSGIMAIIIINYLKPYICLWIINPNWNTSNNTTMQIIRNNDNNLI